MSGLSNHQPMLIPYLHCPELMGRMMERTGVSPTEAARVDGGLCLARSPHEMHLLSPCREMLQLA